MTDGREATDDGRRWGWIDAGVWHELPKMPMARTGLGPPPFYVSLPSGEVRHVVHDPADQPLPLP
jgi:hypothetical protein